ncbi:helix-turn-helix domain-containing protein [Nocardioides sp. KC13]|uniref:Helix-turn-helix domain-containing protein n=1 Tax=Nocardioides turkmenicus TaxID=2711220 RepID=A0A6M1R6K6_9ACTN|nr:helix-turn-helix domain-containing protein [Nocardioides sp. KC13]
MSGPTRRAREALGDALRTARREAGVTGVALAAQLQRTGQAWSQPKISRIEAGRQVPTSDEVRAWATAVGADLDRLLAIQQRASWEYSVFRDAFQDDDGAAALQRATAAAEKASTTIFNYEPAAVPGLCQTPGYAAALLELLGGPVEHGASEDDVAAMIAARMRRSSILYEPGRNVTILVSETALHPCIGGPAVMRAQLEHLADLAIRAKATVGIVPLNQYPVLVGHGWVQRDQVVTIETTAGSLEIADPVEVAQYERWAEALTKVALTGSDAADRCLELARGLSRSNEGGA